MSRFAEGTQVSSEASRAEIERTLVRYGATSFAYGWETGRAVILFRAHDRHLRFNLPMPARDSAEFTKATRTVRNQYGDTGHRTAVSLPPEQAAKRYEQAVRQRWRALALVIKAKLEAVETGITSFESEFLAQIVLPDGRTMAEHSQPLIAQAYSTGKMPPLLPHLGD